MDDVMYVNKEGVKVRPGTIHKDQRDGYTIKGIARLRKLEEWQVKALLVFDTPDMMIKKDDDYPLDPESLSDGGYTLTKEARLDNFTRPRPV